MRSRRTRLWMIALLLAAWAGGIGTAAGQPDALPPNVVPLEIHKPHAGFNRLFVSVTLCVPGTTRCATVDDVMVDTGSTGLRLEPGALPRDLQLPAFLGPGGGQVGECVRFLHDNAWGALFRADLHMGGVTAADLPIQIIGSGQAPASCSSSDAQATANGTLGVASHLDDCSGGCRQDRRFPTYFSCAADGCAAIADHVDRPYRLPNPVSRLPAHNNGIILDLPAPPSGGADSVTGRLTFGVGTSADNVLGPAHLLRLDRMGRFTTLYDGRSYPASYIDSGTETDIVPDDGLPRCPGLDWAFCASPTRELSATVVGQDGGKLPIAFAVGDYADLTGRHMPAASEIAVAAPPSSNAFVWGAPFFFGKRVFLVIDGKPVPGADGVVGPLYGWR